MTTSVMSADAASARAGLPGRILALMPLWVLLIVSALSADFLGAMGTKPPDILGMPLASVSEAAALLWMLVGVAVLWNARSRVVESLALTVFTIPATVVVVLTPAVINVLRTLR